MPFQNYSLAANWNNAIGLANVETAFPKYQNKPLIVRGRGGFDPGIQLEQADFLPYTAGKQTFIWRIKVMGINQYNYLMTTYSRGGNSYGGKITARTRNAADSYANYSATYQVPTPSQLQMRADAYLDVVITFVVEAAL